MRPDLRASRELLFPGAQPPLSHFGVTLLRHVVLTGLRYSLYQLGLPTPERAPVRIVSLRLYLDAGTLREVLAAMPRRTPGPLPGDSTSGEHPVTRSPRPNGEPRSRGAGRRTAPLTDVPAHLDEDPRPGIEPGGEWLLGALLDPGGAANPRQDGDSGRWRRATRLRAAAAFHRLRLRLARAPRRACGAQDLSEDRPETLWQLFRGELSRSLPQLNDAFLAEVVAALSRRRARGVGRDVPPCLGRESWRLRAGRSARLDCLGDPDPLVSSWAGDPAEAARAARRLAAAPLPPNHALRGRFRERYRAALNGLAARYRLLAADAARRGLLDDPEDAFFLPFDLAEDLTAERRPSWLPAAVAANRREHRNLLAAACPPARITHPWSPTPGGDAPEDWTLAALNPLP